MSVALNTLGGRGAALSALVYVCVSVCVRACVGGEQ